MIQTCANCIFGHSLPWSSETGEGVNHFCRLDPPEFVPPNSSNLKPVLPSGWCGKWQTGSVTTKSVPAPGSDPKLVSFPKLSVPARAKKGIEAIV